jgi:HlyD family secretion protein
VATISGDTIHLRPVKIYRDLGESVELEGGLNAGDQVVLNPPTNIHENQRVKISPPANGQGGEQVAADSHSRGQK